MNPLTTMLRDSVEYERQKKGLEKAAKILEAIRQAEFWKQDCLKRSEDSTVIQIGSDRYLMGKAEKYQAISDRMRKYYRKHLLTLTENL